MPDQMSRLPIQLGCWQSFQTPASQNRPTLAGSPLNSHFCPSAAVSSVSPSANIASPAVETTPTLGWATAGMG
eukprot:CAMPEP_0181197086 /NCGR_PEP_ID=MMETSP1096-20121128/15838_1 /TAXON_ID=156174 ORGANISM="Chrysochromulina ericina, Strain CCMP281" /NCGR_SAMPLE_ID=MMETSP1096 /ASSEMBLY_ACC=CAM_ASM_000453 /LENGTH=72 /DNA_ID=CAMNT_0023286943 /DNA_START=732 /DNA_END=950 /DNA_ORIENTATION=-